MTDGEPAFQKNFFSRITRYYSMAENFSQEKEGMKHLMTNKSSVSQKVSNSCFHRSMEVQRTKIL